MVIQESTLRTVVMSVLKSKRARLSRQNGFIAHFYDISEQVPLHLTLALKH